jgi:hypothetical protein
MKLETDHHWLRQQLCDYNNCECCTTLEFDGFEIGSATSQSATHNMKAHAGQSTAAPGQRCSACRWMNVFIYETVDISSVPGYMTTHLGKPMGNILADRRNPDARGRYVYFAVGMSNIQGECKRSTVCFAQGPTELVQCMTLIRNGKSYVPYPAARALAQAVDRTDDAGLRSAYLSRPV